MTEIKLPPSYFLRRMQHADLDSVLQIEEQHNPAPWKAIHFLNSLSQHECWVLTHHAETVGYVVLRVAPEEGEILNIAIHPYHRRKGLAHALLDFIFGYAKKKKVKSVFLEVRKSNQAAQALYQKLGFHQIGLRKDYYPNPPGREDGYIYAKELLLET